MIRLLALILALAGPAAAEEVVAGLSQTRIAIDASFAGSEILIFGAVKREDPIQAVPLGVIVTVAGPSQPVTVRRKERVAGIWVNTDSVVVDLAPSFYAVATSGPVEDVLRNVEDLRWNITIPRAIRSVGAPTGIFDAAAFTEALIRIRTRNEHYLLAEGAVTVTEETLFSTSIALPADLVEGDHAVRIFLTREGRVIHGFTTTIFVQKVGLERWLYTLAHSQPLLYGLLSLALAALAGWAASAAFRYLRS